MGKNKKPGNVLLSHAVTSIVPSPRRGLTAVFGMGTGGSPSPWSPGIIYPIAYSKYPDLSLLGEVFFLIAPSQYQTGEDSVF